MSSKAPEVLEAFADLLIARPALAKVQITTGPMPTGPKEKIEFHDINAPQEFAGFGKVQNKPSRRETWTITGLVEANADGAGETAIRQARARAYVLLGEVEDTLRANIHVGDGLWTQFARGETRQGIDDKRRWCQIKFELTGEARL